MGLKERYPTDYPLYAICTLDDHHIAVAGGGGSARTGVPNALVYRTAKLLKACITCRDIVFSLFKLIV